MNKIILLFMLSIACNGYCDLRYGNETFEFIHRNGSVILEGTTVLGKASVNGSLHAKKAAIGSLLANGSVDLHNCVINDSATINGSLYATDTKFQKELSVASQKMILKTCSVNSLVIRKVSGYDGAQVVDLRDGTKITGPIVVESGNGEVWISSNSEVAGEVKGCKIIKK